MKYSNNRFPVQERKGSYILTSLPWLTGNQEKLEEGEKPVWSYQITTPGLTNLIGQGGE